MNTQVQQQAIIRAAQEAGIDPSAALAIAERESNFDPNAHSSKTIYGMFQMTGKLRREYGLGDSSDPEEQTRAWAAFFKDNKGEMAQVLGRDPTDAEGYLGHHFGSVRAARMMRMDPSTPVDHVFTPYEMSVNPHFGRAGTVGNLNASVTSDITRRQAKFGGAEAPDLAEFGTPVDGNSLSKSDNKLPEPIDLSQFGTVASQGPDPEPQPSAPVAQSAPDLSAQGAPA